MTSVEEDKQAGNAVFGFDERASVIIAPNILCTSTLPSYLHDLCYLAK